LEFTATSIKEHKQLMTVAIDGLNQQISKSKDYVDSKFSTFSREIQDINPYPSNVDKMVGSY
jgi:hypothetical protein